MHGHAEYGFIHAMDPAHQNRRQRKRMELQRRYEDLKVSVPFPELFEPEDVACDNPVHYNRIKSESVPVPAFWRSNTGRMFPKDYEKPRYMVPRCVVETGIPELRRDLREREAGMSLRAKIKEKLYPKLGKSLVDQKTLHDAFLQINRPYLSGYGDVFEPRLEHIARRFVPGQISAELMEALDIDEKTPPPWLFAMQRLGMPPSYPHVRIPGLNAPIPRGCSYGYQPRGWGECLSAPESDAEEENGVPEVICSHENQYTAPVYTEELEERVVPKREEKRPKREKLYRNVRF